MAYNSGGRCPRIIPHYSNPDVLYRGTPTGDREQRNNVRVINETAFTVANFRTRNDETPGRHTHRLPLIPGADAGGIQASFASATAPRWRARWRSTPSTMPAGASAR